MSGMITAAREFTRAACVALIASAPRLAWRRPPRRRDIAFFSDPAAGLGREKRRSPRYPSSLSLWIRWRGGGMHFGQVAELVDISRDGTLAMVSERLRVGLRVEVSLEEDGPESRIGAVVRGVAPGPSCYRVRLEFSRPCPEAFLAAAIGTGPRRSRPGLRLITPHAAELSGRPLSRGVTSSYPASEAAAR